MTDSSFGELHLISLDIRNAGVQNLKRTQTEERLRKEEEDWQPWRWFHLRFRKIIQFCCSDVVCHSEQISGGLKLPHIFHSSATTLITISNMPYSSIFLASSCFALTSENRIRKLIQVCRRWISHNMQNALKYLIEIKCQPNSALPPEARCPSFKYTMCLFSIKEKDVCFPSVANFAMNASDIRIAAIYLFRLHFYYPL